MRERFVAERRNFEFEAHGNSETKVLWDLRASEAHLKVPMDFVKSFWAIKADFSCFWLQICFHKSSKAKSKVPIVSLGYWGSLKVF